MRHRSSSVMRHRGISVMRHRGISVKRHRGISVKRHRGSSVMRHRGISVKRHRGISVMRHRGSSVMRHRGSSVMRHRGISVMRHRGSSVEFTNVTFDVRFCTLTSGKGSYMRRSALAAINLITRPALRCAAPHSTSLSGGIRAITGLASVFKPIPKKFFDATPKTYVLFCRLCPDDRT